MDSQNATKIDHVSLVMDWTHSLVGFFHLLGNFGTLITLYFNAYHIPWAHNRFFTFFIYSSYISTRRKYFKSSIGSILPQSGCIGYRLHHSSSTPWSSPAFSDHIVSTLQTLLICTGVLLKEKSKIMWLGFLLPFSIS